MTTIVYDGNSLAADSRATGRPLHICEHCENASPMRTNASKKIHTNFTATTLFRKERVIAVGGSGSVRELSGALELLRREIDIESVYKGLVSWQGATKRNTFSDEVSFALLIVTEKTLFKFDMSHNTLLITRHVLSDKMAIGSGSKAALTWLSFPGINSALAVYGASLVDKGTGGDITQLVFGGDQPQSHTFNFAEIKGLFDKCTERLYKPAPTRKKSVK